MGTGKTYSTKYLLDSNNSSGVAGQVLSTTSTGIDWVDSGTLSTGLWLKNGDNIYNSNSGSVGIGVTSLSDWGWIIDHALQFANGAFVAGRTDSTAAINLGSNAFVTATGGNAWKYFAAGAATRYIQQVGEHYFQVAGVGSAAGDTITWSTALNIANNGNVGIGTTSPGTRLHVVGSNMIFKVENASTTTNDYSQMLLQAGTATNYIWTQNQNSTNYGGAYSLNIYTQQAGPIAFFTNGNNERMRITSTGNVGIGRSTSITAALFVEGPADTSTISTSSTPAARINNGGAISNWIGSNGYNYGYIQSIQDDGSNNLKHISLNPLGSNVGIGETNPSEKLHMNNTTETGCFIRFQNTGGSGVYIGGRSEDMEMYTNGTLKMAIGSNGSVKFNSYNNANQTGTPTYLLGTDASGNIVKTNTIPGSDPGPYLPLTGNTTATAMTGNIILANTQQVRFLTSGNAIGLRLQSSAAGNSFIDNENGDMYIRQEADNKDMIFQADDGSGSNATYFKLDGSLVNGTTTLGAVNFPDKSKLFFGNDSDLRIYHDGSNSYIDDAGTGSLFIRASAAINLTNPSGSENIARFIENDRVELYFNGVKKFETTSAGVTVTGSLVVSNDITATGDLDVRDIDARNLTLSGKGTSAATITSDGSSTLTTKGYVDSLITGATIYRGTWDPDVTLNSGYGNPNLNTVTKTSGYYYICDADGTATPNGTGCEPDSWSVGDWVIWNDDIVDCAGTGTGGWQKIDNSSVLSGVGTGQTVALWEGPSSVTDSETLGNAPITVSGNDTTFSGNVTIDRSTDGSLIFESSNASKFLVGYDSSPTGFRVYNYVAGETALFIDATNSNATFAGDVKWSGGVGRLVSNQLQSGYNQNADNTDFWINYTGYQGGSTYFRDFRIGDGKQNQIAFFDGSTKNATFTGNIIFTDGAAYSSAASIRQQSNNLILSGGSDGYYFNKSDNSVTHLRIDSSGNVGIGTNSPSSRLEIKATSATHKLVSINRPNSNTAALYIGNDSASPSNGIISSNYSDLIFGRDQSGTLSEWMRIKRDGNVGIGTTSPSQKLDVVGYVRSSSTEANARCVRFINRI